MICAVIKQYFEYEGKLHICFILKIEPKHISKYRTDTTLNVEHLEL